MHGTKDMYDLRALSFRKVADLEPEPTAQEPYAGVPQNIPGVIAIANYDEGGEGIAYHDSSSGNSGKAHRADDVDISLTDAQPSVGWTVGGEWLEYTVNVSAGSYDLYLEASSATAGGQLEVLLDGQRLGLVSVAKTGSWSAFKTFSLADVAIAQGGRKVLRLNLLGTKDMYDLRSLRFTTKTIPDPEPQPDPTNPQQAFNGVVQQIPGLITIPDYDLGGEGVAYHDTTAGNAGKTYRSDGVDLSRDAGAVSVGWTAAGEWLEYTVNVIPGT
jgi:hypothetical protein